MLICHSCNNKLCVNTEHLYVGTHSDNMSDVIRHGNVKGVGNGRAKLTDADVQEIRRQYATGTISQVELGRRYNVAQGHISEIVLGKQWTHVPKAGT